MKPVIEEEIPEEIRKSIESYVKCSIADIARKVHCMQSDVVQVMKEMDYGL